MNSSRPRSHLARALSPAASAVLVDAYYGAWNTRGQLRLAARCRPAGARREIGRGQELRGAPMGEIEPGWSVGKIKRMGADAVKLLAQFEPTEPASAEHQFALIRKVYEECQKHDILMLLETVAFPIRRREEGQQEPAGPQGRDRARKRPLAQPLVRRLQG